MASEKETVEAVMVGQKVYALSKTAGWCFGTVQGVSDDATSVSKRKAAVAIQGSNEVVNVPTTSSFCHTIIDQAYDPRDADLFKVGDLHVATLLFCLKERYERLGQQYSKMGDMILSVNPFQTMPFNGPQERERYLTAANTDVLPPHVWHIADKAYKQIVVRQQGNQSVVISGESGSGKTENTKALISYLSQMSHRHSSNAVQRELADRVSDRLRFSNPILESFGNARTVRNDNSSRFGKYTKLYFDPQSGVMVGGEMVTYLLEKSRILTCGEGERAYHVYYEMLAGLPPAKKQALHLKSVKEYSGLNAGDTTTRRATDGGTVNDAEEFQNLVEAMGHMGIDEAKQDAIWRVLAAVLHLGEVNFTPDANDKAQVANDAPLKLACDLLGIDPKTLTPCFLEKSKTKIMTTLSTVNEAGALRDAFAKALYIGVFDFLVRTINAAIAPQNATTSRDRYIGVLDIFGFENFKKNSFEQLCINFANEGLANHYNKFTFQNDEAECKAEGIACPPIVFPDNAATLDMLEKDKVGIFPLLDEECNFKGGTSSRYTSQVWEHSKAHPSFILPKSTVHDTFGVHHYASDVMYNTDNWLEKNNDALKSEARDCLRASNDPSGLIKTLFDDMEVTLSDGTKSKKMTVSIRFRNQLGSLRSELEGTETHFVRCIKPNMRAEPKCVDNEHSGAQLESAGVLQTIALKRQGYPVRRTHKDFATFFLAISPKAALPLYQKKDYRGCCQKILDLYTRLYGWQPPHFAIGHNKVFCKAFIWSKLEKLIMRKNRYRMKRCVPYLVKWIRSFREKKAEEERKRQEQQRLMQEQAAQRAAMGSEATQQVARNSGLSPEKVKWFDEVALVFANFELPVLLDVCYNLDSRDKVMKALTEMQKQRIDNTLPTTLKQLFSECGIRDSVAEGLIAKGVVSLAKLGELSEEQMRGHGLNEQEIKGVSNRLLRQQGEVLVNQRLAESIGSANFDSLLEGIREQAHKAVSKTHGVPEVMLVKLMQMGFDREQSTKALEYSEHDLNKAVDVLMSGAPIPAAPAGGGGGGAAAAPAAAAAAPAARPPPPNSRPVKQPPPQPVQQQPAYNRSGGDDPSPSRQPPQQPPQPQRQPAYPASNAVPQQPNYNAHRPPAPSHPPPQQQQQQQQQWQQPPPPQPQPAGPQVDPNKVRQITNMGFPQDQAVQALLAANHDVQAALNNLLGA